MRMTSGSSSQIEHGLPVHNVVRSNASQRASILVASSALQATNLLQTFGCVDLLQRADGSWVVLEVGTDGLFTHVDRDLSDSAFEAELLERICDSFARKGRALLADAGS